MATISPGLKTTVDTVVNDLVTELSAKQTTFFTANSKYWEGRLTHAIIPADGVGTAPTKTNKQTDFDDWDTFGGGVTLPALMECCVCVIAYNGPLGKGYCVYGFVNEGAIKYSRCENVGPDTSRTFDWTEYNEPY